MRRFLEKALIATFALGGIQTNASAQSRCDNIKPSPSSGMIMSISKVAVRGDNVNVNLTIRNTTKGRIYLIDVFNDPNQYGHLGNGDRLPAPNISGISTCPTVSLCTHSSSYQDLALFSYIEPDDALSFSFSYFSDRRAQSDDTISFSPVLLMRLVPPGENPDKPLPSKVVRFNFNSVPIGC